jgi:pyruvate dehydrogenase E1 component alpha subunit
MKRYPAFDPPEYVSWTPDSELLSEYGRRVSSDPEREGEVSRLDADALLGLYRDLLRTRLHDIGLKRWVRTGVISKAWLGTGEEAVTVGAVAALDRERDVVSPMIRNAGALHMMGVPLADLFRGYLATSDSSSGGRDLHIVNLAAVQDVPAIFVIQNNQIALGTRVDRHGAGDLALWPQMYGIPSWTCDGNNVLDVYAATRLAVQRCRAGQGPAAVVAETFRMGGHATHDEREARATFPSELFEAWGRRDPIGLFEAHLMERGVPADELERVEAEVIEEMERAADDALASKDRTPPPAAALYEGVSEGRVLIGLDRRPI